MRRARHYADPVSTAHAVRPLIRRYVPDVAFVAGTWAVLLWGVGAQWWTGMNAPDSQFSASLAIFGADVHERALDGSYYWTRLGYLAPVHALTRVLGVWAGFAVWRALLLLLIVGAAYWMARHRTGRALATALAAFVGLNTMVLAYLGNPYATGTAMAATFVLLALGACWLSPVARPQARRPVTWLLPLATGAVIAWLVMLNPYNAMLACALWLSVRIVALVVERPRLRALAIEAGAVVVGFTVVFGALLLAGRAMFPGLDWLGTYRAWNARLDYASFISDPHIWLRDPAMLVLLLAVITCGCVLIFVRDRWTWAALAVAVVTIAFTLLYMQVIPGPWIEAPHYAAMCWPGALTAIVLALSSVFGRRDVALVGWLLIVPLVVLMVWAGHAGGVLTMSAGLSIVLLTSAVVLVTVMLCATRGALVGWLAVMVALIVLGLASQFLQNGRGNLGIYGQYPMNAAFVDYSAEDLMRANVAAEEFVLAHTADDDRIATWTDPERLGASIAAMQLWGKYNNVPEGPALTLDGMRTVQALRPSAIVMVAPHREQVETFYDSIPLYFVPTPLECTSVPYLGIGSPDAQVCVTHLRGL